MLYMLDTNICIFLMKRKSPIYFEKLEKLRKEKHSIAISSIVLSELQYSVANSQFKEQSQTNLNTFVQKLEVLPYTEECAYFYGETRAKLKKIGRIIGGNDALIASHAMTKEAILITNNFEEFQRVEGLVIEHWEQY
jgi:tRNA(fMet)-specific endonuclease VapC